MLDAYLQFFSLDFFMKNSNIFFTVNLSTINLVKFFQAKNNATFNHYTHSFQNLIFVYDGVKKISKNTFFRIIYFIFHGSSYFIGEEEQKIIKFTARLCQDNLISGRIMLFCWTSALHCDNKGIASFVSVLGLNSNPFAILVVSEKDSI
jgi:hypothetical protein